jgi:hypothetical protein
MKAALDWVIRITRSCDSFERPLRLFTTRCHQFQVWMMTQEPLALCIYQVTIVGLLMFHNYGQVISNRCTLSIEETCVSTCVILST